jgi:hypothetical protein
VIDGPYNTNEDESLTIPAGALLANDTDANGDTLTVIGVGTPSNGSAVLNSDGSITYTPAANYHGNDIFTYELSDGYGGNALASVAIIVDPINDAPEAADDSVETIEDEPIDIVVLANDTDIDGDPLTITEITTPANGTATINLDGTITYTPNADYHGADSFTYTLSDSHGGSATATVAIIVEPANDDPVAVDDFYTLVDNDVLILDAPGLLGNDTDPDFDSLTSMLVTSPEHGTVTLDATGALVYAPDNGFSGIDSFSYIASDGLASSPVAIVHISVPLPTLNIGIFHGHDGDFVPGALEETVGAFTIANLNDTDGDAIIDASDENVDITTPELQGKAEVDLMRFRIGRPETLALGTLIRITPNSPNIRFWQEATKLVCINPDGGDFNVAFQEEIPFIELWVEVTAASNSVRDLTITAESPGFSSDTVKATAVWAQLLDHEMTTRPATTNFDQGIPFQGVLEESPWSALPNASQIAILIADTYHGTGPRPLDPAYGLANVMVQAWTPLPTGILDEPQVKFTIVRRANVMARLHLANGTVVDAVRTQYPSDPDSANDAGDHDSDNAQAGGLLFVEDNPGLPTLPTSLNVVQVGVQFNFEEFVRVSVDGTRHEGDGNLASRASSKFPWYSQSQIVRDGINWTKTNNYNAMGAGNDWTFPD